MLEKFGDAYWRRGVAEFFDSCFGDIPPGAMFFWPQCYENRNRFWDNKTDDNLWVMTPGGIWNIDSRASNCTLPNDRLHRCWVREGDPPNVTVGKNGFTCSAGAGSIQCGSYHGFLTNGYLQLGR